MSSRTVTKKNLDNYRRCDYLVTLDKKHLNNPSVKKKVSKIEIVSPKELLMTAFY